MLDISAELKNYEARESKFEELSKKFKKVTKKQVYSDYNFPRSGKVMGIIRHILQNPKKAEELLHISGLSRGVVEFFRDYAGNTSYLASDGTITETREMDVARTQAVVKLIANQLDICLSDEDITTEITQSRWDGIVKIAKQRARQSKKLSKQVNTEIVPNE